VFGPLHRRGRAPRTRAEPLLSSYLYTAGQPDPDLLIRTSGEMRISNFLLWQIAYSEIWVTDVLWPDFRRKHLLQAVLDYQKRERRYGGVGAALAPGHPPSRPASPKTPPPPRPTRPPA